MLPWTPSSPIQEQSLGSSSVQHLLMQLLGTVQGPWAAHTTPEVGNSSLLTLLSGANCVDCLHRLLSYQWVHTVIV